MGTRDCEFCKDRQEEFDGIGHICGCCHGTKQLGITECFCHAYTPDECACDADWSDYVYWEDDDEIGEY